MKKFAFTNEERISLTTKKVKRQQVAVKYNSLLDALYSKELEKFDNFYFSLQLALAASTL